jgi:cell fate (sporulation/competence/biofilm development) regulator YlbF (YheA/YmcA/DUF963 family)
MQTIIEESVITQKTRELCQTILDQPEVQNIRRQIESFMMNDEAKTQYQLLSEKGEFLQHKQQQGLPLSNEEVADFEQSREALFNNPVARGFLDAQQEMHKMQESLGQYVAKTFELGRVPSPDDFQSGSCGSGCGCH